MQFLRAFLMMCEVRRLLLLVLIAVSFVAFGSSQELSLPEPGVRGLVDQMVVTEEVVRGSSASAQGEENRRQVFEFDDGRLVRQRNFVPTDQLVWESTFEYDSDGNVVRWTAWDEEGREKWRYEYSYGPEDRLEREVVRDGAGRIEEVLVYDYTDDDLAEETRYGPANSVRWRKTYSHDEEDRLRTWSVFYPDGTRLKQVEERYDARGRLVREVQRDGIGTVSLEISYEYGLWSTPRSVSVFDGDGSLVRQEERRLDAGGNVLEEHVSRGDREEGSEVAREYDYDGRGNWIRKRTLHFELVDGRRTVTREKVTTRKINYAGDA